jgi:hypothetical protein
MSFYREKKTFLRIGPKHYVPVLQTFSQKSFSVCMASREILVLLGLCIGVILLMPTPVWPIVQNPSEAQIQKAMEKGSEGIRHKKPPTQLYYRFGSLEDDTQPYGFLMTRLSGLAVLSGHFSLRGEQPSSKDIQRVLKEKALQVVVMIYGNSPTFAKESYLILTQQDRVIKPDRVRFDARASLVRNEQGTPLYRAKIVASFLYGTFDEEAFTTITVFPGAGGKITFDLDLSAVP